jgi:hypothetical protein
MAVILSVVAEADVVLALAEAAIAMAFALLFRAVALDAGVGVGHDERRVARTLQAAKYQRSCAWAKKRPYAREVRSEIEAAGAARVGCYHQDSSP